MIRSFLAQVVQRNITVANKASNVTSASVIHVMQFISSHPGTQQPSEHCSAGLCATRVWGLEDSPLLKMLGCKGSVCSSAGMGTNPCCPFQQRTDMLTHTGRHTCACFLFLEQTLACTDTSL